MKKRVKKGLIMTIKLDTETDLTNKQQQKEDGKVVIYKFKLYKNHYPLIVVAILIIVIILFVDAFPTKHILHKIDRQRVSFKWRGMQPEGWKALFYCSYCNR